MKKRGIILIGFFFITGILFSQEISKEELQFGYFVDAITTQMNLEIQDEEILRAIESIGQNLAKQSERPNIKYCFRILNDPSINAFSGPAGYIYITSGLLNVINSKEELAGILGHEIGHVAHRDQVDRIYALQRMEWTSLIIGSLVAGVTQGLLGAAVPYTPGSLTSYLQQQMIQKLTNQIGGAIGNFMFTSMFEGYSQADELKADETSVDYSLKAGYDPRGIVRAFETLLKVKELKEKVDKEKALITTSLINAKPGLAQRIKNLGSKIAKLNS